MKYLCPAPWTSVDATNNNYRPCCLFDSTEWKPKQSVEDYWASKDLVDLRTEFQSSARPAGCSRCWNLEDQGIVSMRQNLLKEYPAWKPREKLERVKLNTGNTCNISCMMCFDTVSSTYRQFWKNKTFSIEPVNKKNSLTYDDNMHSWIMTNHRQLKYIEVLGGESLFSKQFLDLIDFLVQENSAKNITLYLVTNATICTDQIIAQLKSFKKVVIIASIDGINQVNDYQRWGSKWDIVESNIDKFAKHFDICVHTTVTAFNVARLHEVDAWVKKKSISMLSHNVVSGWPDILPGNIPASLQKLIPEKYQKFLNFKHSNHRLADFIKEWDQARGISISDYMSEWKDYAG